MPKALSSDLTPDERLKQVAVILAQGVLRFQRRTSLAESRLETNAGGREKPHGFLASDIARCRHLCNV